MDLCVRRFRNTPEYCSQGHKKTKRPPGATDLSFSRTALPRKARPRAVLATNKTILFYSCFPSRSERERLLPVVLTSSQHSYISDPSSVQEVTAAGDIQKREQRLEQAIPAEVSFFYRGFRSCFVVCSCFRVQALTLASTFTSST